MAAKKDSGMETILDFDTSKQFYQDFLRLKAWAKEKEVPGQDPHHVLEYTARQFFYTFENLLKGFGVTGERLGPIPSSNLYLSASDVIVNAPAILSSPGCGGYSPRLVFFPQQKEVRALAHLLISDGNITDCRLQVLKDTLRVMYPRLEDGFKSHFGYETEEGPKLDIGESGVIIKPITHLATIIQNIQTVYEHMGEERLQILRKQRATAMLGPEPFNAYLKSLQPYVPAKLLAK